MSEDQTATHSDSSPDQVVALEKQVQSMRIGLKACCLVGSVFLSLKLFVAVNMIRPARDILSDMDHALLPAISKPIFSHPALGIFLLLLSLVGLVAMTLACLRLRNNLFLVIFAVSLTIHFVLLAWIDLALKLPFIKIFQHMQS